MSHYGHEVALSWPASLKSFDHWTVLGEMGMEFYRTPVTLSQENNNSLFPSLTQICSRLKKDADWKGQEGSGSNSNTGPKGHFNSLPVLFYCIRNCLKQGATGWDLEVLCWTEEHSVKQVLLKHDFIHSTNFF